MSWASIIDSKTKWSEIRFNLYFSALDYRSVEWLASPLGLLAVGKGYETEALNN